MLGQVLTKLYSAPGQAATVAHYADAIAREDAADPHRPRLPDTSARVPARAEDLAQWQGRYRDPWFGEVTLCAAGPQDLRLQAARSPMLAPPSST